MASLVGKETALNGQNFCKFCYLPNAMVACEHCQSVYYCSEKCKKQDIKYHSKWCGAVTATLGVDYEIRSAGKGKGMGVFALRKFDVGDKIIVERCVVSIGPQTNELEKHKMLDSELSKAPPGVKQAVAKLSPEGTPTDSEDEKILLEAFPAYFKFKHNTFDLEPGTGLCIHTSRFNHSCIANCCRQYIADQKLMVVSAGLLINVGDEMTICYTEKCMVDGFEKHRQSMHDTWGFSCNCKACNDEDDLQATLVKLAKMDRLLGSLAEQKKAKLAHNVGKKMLAIYEKAPIRSFHFQRTYYDMFQMAILQKETLSHAQECLETALQYYEYLLGGSKPECEELQTIRKYIENIESHPLYLALEE